MKQVTKLLGDGSKGRKALLTPLISLLSDPPDVWLTLRDPGIAEVSFTRQTRGVRAVPGP
jgi:hypothetical protein